MRTAFALAMICSFHLRVKVGCQHGRLVEICLTFSFNGTYNGAARICVLTDESKYHS
jgi:hypothetical protein